MAEESGLVSIIIPVYNGEAYIDDCLDSLVKQTYPFIEIILVDDGSVDSSSILCGIWVNRDQRIKYYFQDNKGVSEARNCGLCHSKGEYIAFVDVDDTCETEFIEELLRIMWRDKCDAVFGGFRRCLHKQNKVFLQGGENLTNITSFEAGGLLSARYFDCGVWGKVYRRSVVYRGRKGIFFDNRFQIGEDYIWLLCILLNSRHISTTSRCLYNYNVREGSASHSMALDDKNMSHLKALEYCLDSKDIGKTGCKNDIEYRLFVQIRIFRLLAYAEQNQQYMAYVDLLLKKYDGLKIRWYRNREVSWISKIKQTLIDIVIYCNMDARLALHIYNFMRKEKLSVISEKRQ